MLNRENPPPEAAQLDESKVEELRHFLTVEQIIRHILPYLRKKDIDALRLTCKLTYSNLTSVLFSNHALLRESPASRLSRNNVLHFLANTNQLLPFGVRTSDLISKLDASDSINIYASLLRALLRPYRVGKVDLDLVNKLMSSDKIYRDIIKSLTGNEYEIEYINQFENEIRNPYPEIINDLNLLLQNNAKLICRVKKVFHSETHLLVVNLREKLKLLNPKVMSLLKKEEQNNLTSKLLDALPIFTKHMHVLGTDAYFCILFMLSFLLKQDHNKKLLIVDHKNKLAQFISLLGHFSDNLTFNLQLVFDKEKWWRQFPIMDIIFAAELDLSTADHPFLVSMAATRPIVHRKHAFYLALKDIYLTDYLNCRVDLEVLSLLPWELFERKRKIECFLDLTKYFLDEFSNDEAFLVIKVLNSIADHSVIMGRDLVRKCISCLIDLYKRANDKQLDKIKEIAIEEFGCQSSGFNVDEEGLLLHLMKFAKGDNKKVFTFSNNDMEKLIEYIIEHLNDFDSDKNINEYLMQVIRVFVELADLQQLRVFAACIENNKIISDKSRHIVSAQLVVDEFKKRGEFCLQISQLKEKLKNELGLILDFFDLTVVLNDCYQETYRLSKLVAEKSFDVTSLIHAFLAYFSAMAKNPMAFSNPNLNPEFVYYLVHRMTQAELIEFRKTLVSILDSLLQSKTNDLNKISFGRVLFNYVDFVIPLMDDDFNYLNVMFPMLINWNFQPVQNTRERLLSIIGWQVISKNHPLPDDNCLKDVNHPACIILKLLADKAKKVHYIYNSSEQKINNKYNKFN